MPSFNLLRWLVWPCIGNKYLKLHFWREISSTNATFLSHFQTLWQLLDQSKSDYWVLTRLGQGSNERIEGLKEGRASAFFSISSRDQKKWNWWKVIPYWKPIEGKKATRSLSVRQLLGLRTEDFLLFSCGCIVAPHAICRECFFVVCRAYIQDRSRRRQKKSETKEETLLITMMMLLASFFYFYLDMAER